MGVRKLVAGGLAGLLLLSGCGADDGTGRASDPAGEPSTTYPSPLVTRDGALMVTCDGETGFPVSVLPDGVPDVLTQQEAEAIFKDLLSNEEHAGELKLSFLQDGAAGTEWRVLRDGGDAYTFGLGSWTAEGPASDAYEMTVHREGGGWSWDGGGGCNLEPMLETGVWVELTEPTGGLDRTSTQPAVGVTESLCTSGRDPRPHLLDPVVVETDAAVTVYWTSTPPTGAETCIGSPPTEMTLTLAEPLGDRRLLDGSSYPPAPIPDSLVG